MKKRFFTILTIIIIFVLVVFFYISSLVYTGFDINKSVYIEISNGDNYDTVKEKIKDSAYIKNVKSFDLISKFYNYPENIKTGRYKITPDMNTLQVVRLLKGGHQTPVRLTFNNIRLKDDLIARLSDQLMISSEEIYTALTDSSICSKYGFNTESIIVMFIPNTYEVYWNISSEKLMQKMNNEYIKFWNADRISKSEKLGLNQIEVSTLASIVEEECYFSDEYPVVAGLYLNRLRQGMKLQADPTVKYAVGDFSLRRVLNKHLDVDSPYNTYKYEGLPPNPIRIPSIKAIDAVLNYQNNDYIYMCAKEDFSGRHNFAKTHDEHLKNRQRYTTALNKRNIYQ